MRSVDEGCEGRMVHPDLVALGKANLLSEDVYLHLAQSFSALADPSRAKILYSLLDADLCTCDLAAIVGLSEPGVSQHLRVLRHLGIVKSRREGRAVSYSLDDPHVRQVLTLALQHHAHRASSLEQNPARGGMSRVFGSSS